MPEKRKKIMTLMKTTAGAKLTLKKKSVVRKNNAFSL